MNPMLLLPQPGMTNPAIRDTRIDRFWDAYEGANAGPFKESPDNTRINLYRWLVDSRTAWLVGRDVEISTGGLGRTPEEEAIDRAWPMPKRMLDLAKLRMNGGVTGHGFVKVVPDRERGARVIVLDSSYWYPVVDPEDWEFVIRYVGEWQITDAETGKTSYRRQIHERVYERLPDGSTTTSGWIIADYVGVKDHWEPAGEINWPYPQSQIVDVPNLMSNEYWGQPDGDEDLLSLIAQIERVISLAAKIGRLHADPLPWTRGLDAGSQDAYNRRPNGSAIHLDDLTQEIGHDEFSGDSIESLIALFDKLMGQFHKLTGLPDEQAASEKVTDTAVGTVELRMTGLIHTIQALRRTYGRAINEISAAILAVSGRSADADPVAVWPPVLPEDILRQVQVAQAMLAIGISRKTALAQLHLDAEEEALIARSEAPTTATNGPEPTVADQAGQEPASPNDEVNDV